MEDEIKEELEKRYKNLEIAVYFLEFGRYIIKIKLNKENFEIEYKWDNHFTLESNINVLEKNIDNFIIECYKRKDR